MPHQPTRKCQARIRAACCLRRSGSIGGSAVAGHTGLALAGRPHGPCFVPRLLTGINVYGLADGGFRRTFGSRGAAAGEFTYPTGIAVAGGRVYTTERMGGEANRRVQVLSLNGELACVAHRPPRGFGRAAL